LLFQLTLRGEVHIDDQPDEDGAPAVRSRGSRQATASSRTGTIRRSARCASAAGDRD